MEEDKRFIKATKEIKPSEIEKFKNCHLTVGKLKAWIEKFDVSDDALICTQRIEDFYYLNNSWATLRRKDNLYGEYEVNEYSPVWSAINYSQDKEEGVLLLDLHC